MMHLEAIKARNDVKRSVAWKRGYARGRSGKAPETGQRQDYYEGYAQAVSGN